LGAGVGAVAGYVVGVWECPSRNTQVVRVRVRQGVAAGEGERQ